MSILWNGYQEKTKVLIILVFSFIACSEQKPEFDFSMNNWEEGDVVFRRGNGTKSRAVLSLDTLGIYSHVGIVVKFDSVFMIVHVVPGERDAGETVDKIKMESPEQFFSPDRAEQGAVARLQTFDSCAVYAARYASKKYESGILFDHDYDLNDSTEMYCSELIWRSYLSGGYDITMSKRSEVRNFAMFSGTYIFPSDIYVNKQLMLVYKY